MALTLGPSVLNSIDMLDKVDIDIFVLMTWSAASSTSRGIVHSWVRSGTDMDWDCSVVDSEPSFSCIKYYIQWLDYILCCMFYRKALVC